MKLFTCSNCNSLLYFENTVCLQCGSTVGFDPVTLDMKTLEPSGPRLFADIKYAGVPYRFCLNSTHAVCNWLITATEPFEFCIACRLNRTIPSLFTDENLQLWRRIEGAKHRLLYALLKLELPVTPKSAAGGEAGIAFNFLASPPGGTRVITGHDQGTITLDIDEADEASRVKHKLDLGERYRTLLGHFRHEIGHYYWDLLYKNNAAAKAEFRDVFGDERADYAIALNNYYAAGPPAGWNNGFISPYATAHPWEDWAETWAHYLHLMDTLETAFAFGIEIHPGLQADALRLTTKLRRDPYLVADFGEIVQLWLPLAFAINSLNRSMGHSDFYPFIIAPEVVRKLSFIHRQLKKAIAG